MTGTGRSTSPLVPPPPPAISAADASRLARDHFRVVASAEPLGSHQDRNFLLTSTDGAHRLFKIANPGTSVAELEAQSVATRLVAEAAPWIRVPLVLDPETGADSETGASTVPVLEHEGQSVPARVLGYLDGDTLSGSGHLAPRAVRALGQLAAQVDLALVDFEHPGALRESQWDLRRAAEVLAVLLRVAACVHAVIADTDLTSSTDRSVSLFHQLTCWLDDHLADEHLSARALADNQFLSARYIRKVFAEHGTTVSGYVKQRRLQMIRNDLLDPRQDFVRVSVIAARWGFRDPSVFSRAFHSAFGGQPAALPPPPRGRLVIG